MKRYLLDTSILSDFLNKRHEVAERCEQERLAGNLISTSIPVIGELFFGAFLSRDPIKSCKLIQRGTARITCWPFTIEASETYGEIAAILRRQGNLIQHIDMQTAAIALMLGNCTVVATDSDFNRIPGLTVENWRVS